MNAGGEESVNERTSEWMSLTWAVLPFLFQLWHESVLSCQRRVWDRRVRKEGRVHEYKKSNANLSLSGPHLRSKSEEGKEALMSARRALQTCHCHSINLPVTFLRRRILKDTVNTMYWRRLGKGSPDSYKYTSVAFDPSLCLYFASLYSATHRNSDAVQLDLAKERRRKTTNRMCQGGHWKE